ncbi:hypothetical protein NQ314_010767 [Rhamnusium bicolor]|uniref:Uncharacterized protein n=1 Tax=Rhamnusium bicolor TaxID=1586634 RepID=A0AAV8XNY4_9CUCU|nr:hypothetical protein NQ314_010767 [Rhamnusium bicolor]
MDSGTASENVLFQCKICNNCGENVLNTKINIADKCSNWLDRCSLENDGSMCSDLCETSSGITNTSNNSKMDSDIFEREDIILSNNVLCENNGETKVEFSLKTERPQYDSINIYKSKRIHIGDITYIKGPVIIKNNTKTETGQNLSREPNFNSIMAIPRTNWLAQPAMEKEYLIGPAKFVIIGHTATEEGFTQAENTLLIRLIQTFHIESRKWKDIAYNFLIGSDGNAYEGRGWGVVGSHTRYYNSSSIGISFIGCFLNHLPPSTSLKKAKAVIEYGLKIGAISPDYILLAHCQCSGVESPGKRLFEEIKNWNHWDGSITVNNPPPVIEEKIELVTELIK